MIQSKTRGLRQKHQNAKEQGHGGTPARGHHGLVVVGHTAVAAYVFPAASGFLRGPSFSYAIFTVFFCVLPLKIRCI